MTARSHRTRHDVMAAIGRQSRVLVTSFVVLATGAVLAVLLATPKYEGTTRILVKQDRADSVVTGAADSEAERQELTEADLMSQAELIKSHDLLEAVADQTGLARRVVAERPSIDQAEALARATEQLGEDLAVTPVRRTWLIDVAYGSDDPRLTRNVLDTLVRRYLQKHLELHRPSGTYQFFADQVRLARKELDEAQARLTEFSATYQVVSAGREKDNVLQQLAEFDTMRSEARTLLAATTQQLSAITSELSTVPAQHTSAVRTVDAAGVVEDVKARILTLELRRAELVQRFTPAYRGVVEIDEQLREARAALDEARRSPIREETVADNPTRQWLDTERARVQAENAAIRARLQALSATVGEYRTKAQRLNTRDVEQQDLLRRLKEAEDKYLLYAKKQEEARISDELDRTRIANVVVAQAPSVSYEAERNPSFAMLPLLFGVSLLLSLGLALAVDAAAPVDPQTSTQDAAVLIWSSNLPREEKHRAIRTLCQQARPTT